MNAGAAVARGRILLFVHADTLLPAGYADIVERLLSCLETTTASFPLSIDHPRRAFRWLERLVNLRSRRLGLPYGDQGLAIRTADFYRLGGFSDLPVMEDYEFLARTKRYGKTVIADKPVQTSPRRWLRTGVLRLSLINQACILGYHFGVSPARLAAWRSNDHERGAAAPDLDAPVILEPGGMNP
jgi:hypothetical protein